MLIDLNILKTDIFNATLHDALLVKVK